MEQALNALRSPNSPIPYQDSLLTDNGPNSDNFANSVCCFCEEEFLYLLPGERIIPLQCDHVTHYECVYQLLTGMNSLDGTSTDMPNCPTCDQKAMPVDVLVFNELNNKRAKSAQNPVVPTKTQASRNSDPSFHDGCHTPTTAPDLGFFDTPESEKIDVPKPRRDRPAVGPLVLPANYSVGEPKRIDTDVGLGPLLSLDHESSPSPDSVSSSKAILASMQLRSVDVFDTTSHVSRESLRSAGTKDNLRTSLSPSSSSSLASQPMLSQPCLSGAIVTAIPEVPYTCIAPDQDTHVTVAVQVKIPASYYYKPLPPDVRVCNFMSVSCDGGSSWAAHKCRLTRDNVLVMQQDGAHAIFINLEHDLFKMQINTSGRVLALFVNRLEYPRILLANDDEMAIELWHRAILDPCLAAAPDLSTDCSLAPTTLPPVAPPVVTILVVPATARKLVEHVIASHLTGLSRLGVVVYGGKATGTSVAGTTSAKSAGLGRTGSISRAMTLTLRRPSADPIAPTVPVAFGPSRKHWDRWNYHLERFRSPLASSAPAADKPKNRTRIDIVQCLAQVLDLASKRIEHAVLDQEGVHSDSVFHAILVVEDTADTVPCDRKRLYETTTAMLANAIPVDTISVGTGPDSATSDFLAHVAGLSMGTYSHVDSWNKVLGLVGESIGLHHKRLYNKLNIEFGPAGSDSAEQPDASENTRCASSITEITGSSVTVDPRLLYDTDGQPPCGYSERQPPSRLRTVLSLHYLGAGTDKVFLVQVRIRGPANNASPGAVQSLPVLHIKVEGENGLLVYRTAYVQVKCIEGAAVVVRPEDQHQHETLPSPTSACYSCYSAVSPSNPSQDGAGFLPASQTHDAWQPSQTPIPSPIYGQMLLINDLAPILLQSSTRRNAVVVRRQLQLAAAKSLECALGYINRGQPSRAHSELKHCKLVLRAIIGQIRDELCIRDLVAVTKWIDDRTKSPTTTKANPRIPLLTRSDLIMAIAQAKRGWT